VATIPIIAGIFPADGIDAFTTRNASQQKVFEHQKLLGQLRADLEPLRRGNLLNLFTSPHQYVYARNTATASVIVAFNNDKKSAAIEFSVADTSLRNGVTLIDRLGNSKNVSVASGMLKLELAAQSSAILVKK